MFFNLFILTIVSPLFAINSPLVVINIVKDNPFGPDSKRISKTEKGQKSNIACGKPGLRAGIAN